jgi:hypothetical protein
MNDPDDTIPPERDTIPCLPPDVPTDPVLIAPHPAPRYDDVFFDGVRWLNSLDDEALDD